MADVGARVAALALLALVAALVHGFAPLVPAALLGLGGLYAGQLVADDAPLDLASPAFAAGLLMTAELAHWGIDERERIEGESGDGPRRLAYVAALGVGALLLASALLALADGVRVRGLAVDLAGAAAAAAVLLTVVLVTRGLGRPSQ